MRCPQITKKNLQKQCSMEAHDIIIQKWPAHTLINPPFPRPARIFEILKFLCFMNSFKYSLPNHPIACRNHLHHLTQNQRFQLCRLVTVLVNNCIFFFLGHNVYLPHYQYIFFSFSDLSILFLTVQLLVIIIYIN